VSDARGSAAERAYLELVREFQRPILNYLFRMVGDRELAEDLTQETYLRAYRALDRLELNEESTARRRAWLYRIAHNAATDHLRRKALVEWIPLDALRLRGRRRESDPASALAAADPVQRALARLSPEQREVLILFSHDGLDAEEVAEVLRIAPAAARKRRQRARDAFREVYEDVRREM
jgi:RNA polymerase sigma-70 factor (ECF subfamily)